MVIACKKKAEPIDENGSPEFYIKGEIDQTPVNIEAGVNNFFLQTTYNMDNNQVYEFSGNLFKNCSNCKGGLKITLKNYKTGVSSNAVNTDSTFASKKFDFSMKGKANIPYYSVNLVANPTGSNALLSQKWTFSDGSVSNGSMVNKTFKSGTVQQVQYTCNYANTCSSTISYKLHLNYFMKPEDMPAFTYESVDSAHIMYKFTAIGDSSKTYLWHFSDGGAANGNIVYYGFNAGSVFAVSLTAINGNDTTEVTQNINTRNNTDCKANFTSQISPVLDPLNLATVQVEWTDKEGNIYSSAELKQDMSTYFQITENEAFKLNASGMKTQMLKVLINCNLSNGSKSISVKNLQGKIAVAIP